MISINEQRILTAPAITLSDHNRAVYDAKCGCLRRRGWGWSNADTCGHGGGGYEKGSFFADVLYGRPLTRLLRLGAFSRIVKRDSHKKISLPNLGRGPTGQRSAAHRWAATHRLRTADLNQIFPLCICNIWMGSYEERKLF